MGSHPNGYSFPEGKQVSWKPLNLSGSAAESTPSILKQHALHIAQLFFVYRGDMSHIIFNKLLPDSLNDRTGNPLNAQWILNY